jgi:hypothetical protein
MAIAKTIELDKFCKSIMNRDRSVHSVSVLDRKGRLLHNITQPRFVQPSLEKWNDLHYMECTLDISLGAKFDELYGPIRYHYSNKDNFMMFSFPYEKNVVIVTSTKTTSPIAFATKISNIIINSK